MAKYASQTQCCSSLNIKPNSSSDALSVTKPKCGEADTKALSTLRSKGTIWPKNISVPLFKFLERGNCCRKSSTIVVIAEESNFCERCLMGRMTRRASSSYVPEMIQNKECERSVLCGPLNLTLDHNMTAEEISDIHKRAVLNFRRAPQPRPEHVPVFGTCLSDPILPDSLTHWYLWIGSFLFHLRFHPNSQAPTAIRFESVGVSGYPTHLLRKEKIPRGYTNWSTDELYTAGELLIVEFGQYHRAFWNCQQFVNVFLKIVCDENKGPIRPINDTSAALIRYLMFQIPVLSPTASHRLIEENKKVNQIAANVQKETEEIKAQGEKDRKRFELQLANWEAFQKLLEPVD